MLSVSDLGKRYGSRWLFRGLRFELQRGDALAVLGRNGAGKSTLLKALAGLVGASEGVIRRPVGDVRTMLGYTSLELSLYPQLTVLEHLELSARLRGCDSRARELLEQVSLASSGHQPAAQLSTGMKARLKLALSIQAKPLVLLIDEPGAGLDEEGRSLLDHVCAEQRERGVLVIATNDPSERRFASVELELAG